MSVNVYVIKNRGLTCKGCGSIHDFITGQSDRGCMTPLAFSRERAEKIAAEYGLPLENVVQPSDGEIVMLDQSARKLPRPTESHVRLAQEVVKSA